MRYSIRQNVFETNSSSVHTIQYKHIVRQPSKLRIYSKDHKVHVSCGEFGKELEIYDTQQEKLSYLVTLLAYSSGAVWDCDAEELYKNYEFELLEGYIKKYCGCNGIVVTNLRNADIDHQSQPESGCVDFINMYDEDKVLDFIFSDEIALKTDCD